jgi:hypothetical protein
VEFIPVPVGKGVVVVVWSWGDTCDPDLPPFSVHLRIRQLSAAPSPV